MNWLKTSARWPPPMTSPQLFGQGVDLAARKVEVLAVDKAGVQAQLAQQGERAQDGEPVALQVIDQPEDFLPLPLQMPLVDRAVPGVQVHLENLLLLGGQVGGDSLLGAAQDQRRIRRRSWASSSAGGRSRSGGRRSRGTGPGWGTVPAR